MKKFLFNFKTKPTLFTLFIIIGFLCCLGGVFWLFISDPGDYGGSIGGGIVLYFLLVVGISLIPAFIIYRYIIKHFKTKDIFITESVLTAIISIVMLNAYLPHNRHLIIDLSNYSENYYLIISGDGEQKEMDTSPSTFLINYEGVLHENYFVVDEYHNDNTEIIYPKSWQLSVEDSRKQENFRRNTYVGHPAKQNFILSGPFTVDIYYNNAFDYSSRTLDSLATLVLYARQQDVSLSQANEELVNIWAEMNYMYTTILEPYVKNSKAIDYSSHEENENAPPSDHGIYLSYTSYERIIDDLMRRAQQNNWPEKNINELTEYYSARMPFGFFRLHIERPSEELVNSNRFQIREYIDVTRYLTSNHTQPHNVSGSTTWTNTMIFREYKRQDGNFQVTIYDRLRNDWDEDYINSANEPYATFTFDMKTN